MSLYINISSLNGILSQVAFFDIDPEQDSTDRKLMFQRFRKNETTML